MVEQQTPGLIWTVEVAAGPNMGAALSLAPGRYSVGAGAANDIVLADAGIAEEQISLEIGENGAAVTALSPGAMLRRSKLSTGQRRALRPGMELQLGQTRLRFDGPPSRPAYLGKGRITLLAMLVFAGAASAGGCHAANPAAKTPRPALAVPAVVAVAAVLLAPVPHVITRSGERYMEGSVLPGGWVITEITAGRITLREGVREIGITL